MISFVSTSNNQKGLTSVCLVSIARCDVYPPSVVGIGCRLSRVWLLLSVGRSKFGVGGVGQERNFGVADAGEVPGAAIEHATTAAIDSAWLVCIE